MNGKLIETVRKQVSDPLIIGEVTDGTEFEINFTGGNPVMIEVIRPRLHIK